ncbi:MAG: helicase C-terminal domain-containing protein, partial [Candidatus Omnitrophota bacterium]|nr:helicase C-terminal domain-containing protein [Candidatus Omnitrophota bacterium]
SQGQTFEKVIIDLGYGAFTHGQLYVALSRCTRLDGIRLKRPVTPGDIIFDRRIYGLRERFAGLF